MPPESSGKANFVAKSGKYCKYFKVMKADSPLKQLIRDVPPGTVIFRTDYPEYSAEFVGNVLSRLVSDGDIVRLSHGIYCRPQMSRFGAVMPGMAQIARSIARRDGARILPAGVTALNELGLSDQVPMTSTFLTDGCARRIRIGSRTLEFKRGVPRNFIYRTDLAACLVQALKAIGKGQAGSVDLGRIAELIETEPNKDSFFSDLRLAPVWMRRLLMPIIRKYRKKAESPVTRHLMKAHSDGMRHQADS